jgi:UDP-N-acetylmuramoyl-L-alanyl-D-glutamate--2,6-diaminopimelate ligase
MKAVATHSRGKGGQMPRLAGLTADSRLVRRGFLFAALPGTRADGRAFIAEAIANGAVAVLAPTGTALPAGSANVTLIEDDNARRRFAQMAAAFYGGQPAVIAAVTGTSGKTSTVSFARQIWQALGHSAASLGTLGVTAPGLDRYGALTTPDPVSLHATLADLAAAGVDHLAMEASSHGLEQHRLDGVRVSAAGFTNLTREHLDHHGTMEAYFAAKARLFEEVLVPGGTAVLNADVPEGQALAARARKAGRRVATYGRAGRQLRLAEATPVAHGLEVKAEIEGTTYALTLPLVGAFQAHNVLCALGLVLAEGVGPAAAVEALAGLQGVRGRLELVARHPSGAPVFVDYAHKPGALEAVLTALRPHATGRLIIVFGCGGDRDRGKRPEMGAIAARLSDLVIVTDDNPRSEPPETVRREILAGCPGAMEIGDRGQAIAHAVGLLQGGDVLLLAGKGHETGQIVGGVVRPFDDAEAARAAVAGALSPTRTEGR